MDKFINKHLIILTGNNNIKKTVNKRTIQYEYKFV